MEELSEARFESDLARAGLAPAPDDRAAALRIARFLRRSVERVRAYLAEDQDDAADRSNDR